MTVIDTVVWDEIPFETLVARHSLDISPCMCDGARHWEVCSLDTERPDKHSAEDLHTACYLAIAALMAGITPSAFTITPMYEGIFSDKINYWEWEAALEHGVHADTAQAQGEALRACIDYMLTQKAVSTTPIS
jgi:hypothetical protein